MQDIETTNQSDIADFPSIPESGRILALDPGTKKIGIAVSDRLQTISTRLKTVKRTNWKKLLQEITVLINDFDAVALVVGLPLNTDGSESEMSSEARKMARNFSLSLSIPVVLQDERVSTYQARSNLWENGASTTKTRSLVDAEAAAVILRDFLARPK
ncbi:MAG: Holliday junction resolvase RuvX [Pyrinomonadaceae bacterium]